MFPYKTNSPDYLDYVASAMTREEILADPKFCVFLENPYIKDNMEVALRWKDAKFGDYQDKYNFVEYYLCNGPELDADTLLHYRAQASADPVVMEIAYSYFSDTKVLSEIRETKYEKEVPKDWTDCFKNPCFYLGDFSPIMGSMGDSKNLETIGNVLMDGYKGQCTEEKIAESVEEESEQIGEKRGMVSSFFSGIGEGIGEIVDKIAGDDVIKPESEGADEMKEKEHETGQGAASAANQNKIRPSYDEGWRAMGKGIMSDQMEFAKQLSKKTSWARRVKLGDWFGKRLSASIDLMDKANVTRMLGDCYRMWSQVRRLRWYGSDNHYKPITSDQLVASKNPDGTPRWVFKNSHPNPADSTKGISPSTLELITNRISSGLFSTHTNSNGNPTADRAAQRTQEKEQNK